MSWGSGGKDEVLPLSSGGSEPLRPQISQGFLPAVSPQLPPSAPLGKGWTVGFSIMVWPAIHDFEPKAIAPSPSAQRTALVLL